MQRAKLVSSNLSRVMRCMLAQLSRKEQQGEKIIALATHFTKALAQTNRQEFNASSDSVNN
jgi:hypothetical protein